MNPILIGLIGVGAIAVGLSLVAAVGYFTLLALGRPLQEAVRDGEMRIAEALIMLVFVGIVALLVVVLVLGLSYEAGHAVLHLWGRA